MDALLNTVRATFLEVVELGGEHHLDVPRIGGHQKVVSKKHHGSCSRSRLLKLGGKPISCGPNDEHGV